MEGFVALGIVCNLLQLTSYGIKIITVSREIHDQGISNKNEWILYNCVEMGDITRQLDQSLVRLESGGILTPHQQDMSNIAYMCKETAYELQEEIAKLQLDPKKTGWRKALLKSVNTLRSQKVIDDLENRLQKQSNLLQTRLLTDLRVQQEASQLQTDERFSEISVGLQQIVIDLASGQARLVDLFADLNTDLVTLIRAEGEKARQDIMSHIDAIQSKVELNRKHKELLDSLSFTEINDRINTISESHKATFEWIFDPEIQRPWDSFESWLKHGEDIYWISGKPGSGKSVLLKFIVDSTKTVELLNTWAAGKPVFHISFFIWKGGVKLQRQKRGLLCSLLLQLVRHSQAYLCKVLSSPGCLSKRSPLDWSVKELSDILLELANMHIANVCLFIDGLDESEVTDADVGMLNLIKWLARLDGWKVCAASRPEPDFRVVLAKYPKLRLQDLTKKDLEQFALDKLQEINEYEVFDNQGEQSAPNALVKLVCDKADGVFLWVRFAVSTVIRGVRRMDGWDDLMKRLAKLPSELEQLYVDMWQRSEEDQGDYRAEAARYFRMVIAAEEDSLSCYEVTATDSKAMQILLEDSQAYPSLYSILRDCRRTEQRIINSSRGLLESCDVVRKNPRSRSQVVKLTLVEDDTPELIRAFRNKRISFVHRTAVDFLRETTVGRLVLSDGESQACVLSKGRIDASLAAPYCEYPIVDLFDFRDLFYSICNEDTSADEKAAMVRSFETVHEKIIRSNGLSEHADIARNWIDAVAEGKWKPLGNHKNFTDLTTLMPFQFAIGWRSYAAEAGMTAYFQQLLSKLPNAKLNSQYVSCLAACAAHNYHIHAWGCIHELQQLELIKLLKHLGADLNIRFPLRFDSGPLVNPLSLFCMFHNRADMPTEEQKGDLMSKLGHLLESGVDFSQTTVYALHMDFFNGGQYDGEMQMSIHAADRQFALRSTSYVVIVEFNLSALLRFYAQSIGASKEQVQLLLEGQLDPECRLLALTKETPNSTKVLKPVSPDEDSLEFYNRFDMCASSGRLTQNVSRQSRDFGIEERQAVAGLQDKIDEIRDRGLETEYDELMTSLGHWTTTPIMPSDIPFLQPFGHETVDCSKFMFTG